MHSTPHTAEAKAKIGAACRGRPLLAKRRPSRVEGGVVLWRCGSCKAFKPASEFHHDKRTILGLKTQCKRCHSACSIRSRNRDVVRAKAVFYQATRRARMAGANGQVTADDWSAVLAILGRACLCCGASASVTVDHVVPLSRGGEHRPTNLQPLCRRCNEVKQARTKDYRTDAQRAAIELRWGPVNRPITEVSDGRSRTYEEEVQVHNLSS